MFHEELEVDDIVIRCDGTVGFYVRTREYTAAWTVDLLTPEQTLAAARDLRDAP